MGLIPLINFFLLLYLTQREGTLNKFKNHFTCYRLDWLLIPFGALWGLSVNITFFQFLLVFLSFFVISVLVHYYWLNYSYTPEIDFMFDQKNKKFSPAGIVHILFMGGFLTLFASYIFLASKSVISYFAGGLMILFLGGLIYSSKKIHKKIIISDLTVALIGLSLILIRLYLW